MWLGLRLLEQDRALESQRLQDSRERAADLIVAALEQDRSVGRKHQLARTLHRLAMAGGVREVASGLHGQRPAYPRNRLPNHPYRRAARGRSGYRLLAGEEQEFRVA